MQIIWAAHEGNLIEELLGVMLCREFKFANRIRPAQGDGGIDVMVPVGDGSIDVYQIKGFAQTFSDAQKRQVKKSLDRISKNTYVRVRNWYLVVPMNPTPQLKFDWFDKLLEGYDFDGHWFGLDQCDGLAAKYPDVSRYYLGDGRHELEQALGDVRALAGIDLAGGEAGQAVVLDDLRQPLARALEAVNRVDPYYRYELMLTKHMPFSLDSPPPAQPDGLDVAAVASEQISDEAVVTYLVIPRYAEAELDRPIGGKFLIAVDESGEPLDDAAARWLEFGAPGQLLVQDLAFDLPGGLSATAAEGIVSITQVASGASYDLRLVTVNGDGKELGDCVFRMRPVSTGVGKEAGSYGNGVSDASGLEVELFMKPKDGTVSMRFKIRPLAGLAPAAVSSELWFLDSIAHATLIQVGQRFGPFAGGGIPVPPATDSPVDAALLHLVDDMALIQRERAGGLRLPDLEAGLDGAELKAIRIAAALLRGGRVRTDYIEERFTLPQELQSSLLDNLGEPMAIEIVGAWQHEVLGHRVEIQPIDMLFLSAVIRVDDDGQTFVATPAKFSNEMLIKMHDEPDADDSAQT